MDKVLSLPSCAKKFHFRNYKLHADIPFDSYVQVSCYTVAPGAVSGLLHRLAELDTKVLWQIACIVFSFAFGIHLRLTIRKQGEEKRREGK